MSGSQSGVGTGAARRSPAYCNTRWVACVSCFKVWKWKKMQHRDRLRTHTSPCCSTRLRTLTWRGFPPLAREGMRIERREREKAIDRNKRGQQVVAAFQDGVRSMFYAPQVLGDPRGRELDAGAAQRPRREELHVDVRAVADGDEARGLGQASEPS